MEKLFVAGRDVMCDEHEGALIENNVEGALIMQMMLQNLQSPLLVQALPLILETCAKRRES
jgi:hypothetical protein